MLKAYKKFGAHFIGRVRKKIIYIYKHVKGVKNLIKLRINFGLRFRFEKQFLARGKTKYLIQKYVTGSTSSEVHGFGDFVFGCFTVYQEAINTRRVPLIDFSEHPINLILKPNLITTSEKPFRIYHSDSYSNFHSHKVVFTNKRPRYPVDKECVEFVLNNILHLNDEFLNYKQLKFQELGLFYDQFIAIHIRMGDDWMHSQENGSSNSKIIKVAAGLVNMKDHFFSEKLLFISDSNYLRRKIAELKLPIFVGTVEHSGSDKSNEGTIKLTMLDYFSLMNCKSIIQISDYSWGSSFSDSAAILFSKPIKKISVNEMLNAFNN